MSKDLLKEQQKMFRRQTTERIKRHFLCLNINQTKEIHVNTCNNSTIQVKEMLNFNVLSAKEILKSLFKMIKKRV